MTVKKRVSKPLKSVNTSLSEETASKVVNNPLIFVSHDSRDAEIAEAFSKLLSSVSAGMLKSFRSSDRKGTQGIEFGVEWYPEVMLKIDSACDVVCLLTPRSLERPWILYEAGVAKGKLNTPVHGVAIGVPLAKASTGPFAQFQNSDDDEESLIKLALQLMQRIDGAEPDKDTVKAQVIMFKEKTATLSKAFEKESKLTTPKPANLEESSVAKLFEEVKVMFRDLPERVADRPFRASKRRFSRFLPQFMMDFTYEFGGDQDPVGLLIMASFFKEDMPWLYEIGLDAYRALSSNRGEAAKRALERFAKACDLALHHPFFREGFNRNEEMYILSRELNNYTHHLLKLMGGKDTVLPPKKKAVV